MNIIEFKDNNESTEALSEEIACKLQAAIQKHRIAKLLVSGGRSPIPLFEKLSKKNISWKNVVIGLVDERFVAVKNKSSNEKMISDTLLQNRAKEASFFGLIYDLNSKNSNLELARNLYTTFATGADVCLLGMGMDGHTASLFPNDPNSQDNLAMPNQDLLLYTLADVTPYERITCSKNLINRSKNLYLMISGEEKLNVLNNAHLEGLPISHFFQTQGTNLIVHYNKI
jgi:6-phosphogluconolactonase